MDDLEVIIGGKVEDPSKGDALIHRHEGVIKNEEV